MPLEKTLFDIRKVTLLANKMQIILVKLFGVNLWQTRSSLCDGPFEKP